MLHTKFHGNPSTGSREEDFWRVFTIYGRGSHLGHVTSIMSINFHFLVPESLHIKFGFDLPCGFWEKQVLSFVCKWPWVKVKKWPWPSILTYAHFFIWFQVTGCKCSEKSTAFTFSYRKSPCYKNWPCRKIDQGHSRVIIWTNYDGWSPRCCIPSFMKIGPPVLEKKIFEGFLPYMGVAAILVMWPGCCKQTFVPPTQGGST